MQKTELRRASFMCGPHHGTAGQAQRWVAQLGYRIEPGRP